MPAAATLRHAAFATIDAAFPDAAADAADTPVTPALDCAMMRLPLRCCRHEAFRYLF